MQKITITEDLMNPTVKSTKEDAYFEHIVESEIYTIKKENDKLSFYINDVLIDTTGYKIIYNYKIDENFVLDIFSLCDNIQEYNWTGEICEFHKDKSSAMYGPESIYYTRINNIIVHIIDDSCCCSYSGSERYFNLLTNESIYSSCTCFVDYDYINKMLNGIKCNCDFE